MEITSWISFNCHILKGPPFKLEPILFAGTIKLYSKRAIPQLIKMVVISPAFFKNETSLNRKCPYQAMVIKVLEAIKSKMVMRLRDILETRMFSEEFDG